MCGFKYLLPLCGLFYYLNYEFCYLEYIYISLYICSLLFWFSLINFLVNAFFNSSHPQFLVTQSSSLLPLHLIETSFGKLKLPVNACLHHWSVNSRM